MPREVVAVASRVSDENKVRPVNMTNLKSTVSINAGRGVMPRTGDVGP